MFPPRLRLRIDGAKISTLPPGWYMMKGATRSPVTQAKTVQQALGPTGATSWRLMTNAMFKRLPVSGVLGSNAVGGRS